MSDVPMDPAASAERDLFDALFTVEGQREPATVARGILVDGCRYDFVVAALHDHRLRVTPIPPSQDLMFQVAARFLPRIDHERHRATRGAFTGLFSPRHVERYRAGITSTADILLDAFPVNGPVDLVESFTRPLPFAVICRVLGVPEDQHSWLGDRLETFGRAVAGQRERANVDAGNAATVEMLDLFDQLLQERRSRPADDVLTLLAARTGAEDARDDVLANCIFFVMAGHATTAALLTAGVHLLSTHPDQLADVRAGRTTWAAVVEELLRFVSPTTMTGVSAERDMEIAGRPVPAGAHRSIVYAAANRDPEVFEAPDTFQPARAVNPHVAFSAGAHYCLGAPLARMHGEVALALLFSRLPGLRALEEPEWIGSVPIRQVAHLAVTWDRPTS